MKITSTISVLATISYVTALPALQAAPGLDIPALLASLGPAPATDKRFTNWTPPGPNDGEPLHPSPNMTLLTLVVQFVPLAQALTHWPTMASFTTMAAT